MTLSNHMRWLWRKVNFNPSGDFQDDDEEEDQVPELQPVRDEIFQAPNDGPEGDQSHDEKEDDDDNSESDPDEDTRTPKLPQSPSQEYLIPGLLKPLSKSQKKKERKNKRKNVLTPPEDPKEPKVLKRVDIQSNTSDGSSIVTELIRKYSSTNNNDDEEDDSALGSSSSASPDLSSSELPSITLSSVDSSSGSVIPSGVN